MIGSRGEIFRLEPTGDVQHTQSPVPLLNLSLQPIYNGAIAATGFQGDLLILLHVSWFSQTEIYNAIL